MPVGLSDLIERDRMSAARDQNGLEVWNQLSGAFDDGRRAFGVYHLVIANDELHWHA